MRSFWRRPGVDPVTRPRRYVIDLGRYSDRGKFVVQRYEYRAGSWDYEHELATFDTREEAEAWIREHCDLPYEVI